jgi:hypothetical protein
MKNPLTSSAKEFRKARRMDLVCRLFFFGDDDFEGEAQIIDLSFSGCMARSMEPLIADKRLKLSLFLPDGHEWPVRVEDAIIRWVRNCEFGLEFLSIRPPQLHRIQQFMIRKRDVLL